MSKGSAIAATLVGLEDGYCKFDSYTAAHPNCPVQIALAVVLGGIEERTDRDHWRSSREGTARYLNTLAGG